MRLSKKVLENVSEFLGIPLLMRLSNGKLCSTIKYYSPDILLAELKDRLKKMGHTFLTSWSADKKHWEAWVKGYETQTGKTELSALLLAISELVEGEKK